MAAPKYDFDARLQRAVELWLSGAVTKLGPGRYTVKSQSEPGTVYHVVDQVCNCYDCQKWQKACKHSLACDLQEAEWQELITPQDAKRLPRQSIVTPEGSFTLINGQWVPCDGSGEPCDEWGNRVGPRNW
jgi:hypothetical protein